MIQKTISDHYPVLAILAPPTARLAFLASGTPNLEAMLQKQIGVSVAGLQQVHQPGSNAGRY